MAAGNITEQVAIIGKIAAEGDLLGVANAKGEMIRSLVLADPLSSVRVAANEVGGRIAYLAGYLPPELGNEALRIFDAEHPIFGKVIPDDMESAFAAGKGLYKQFALKKQIEAENAKKLRQAADLGVMVPDGDEEVTSDQAAKLMNAVRAKRARNGDALAAKEIAESAEWEAKRAAKVKEEELARITAAAEEEEADDEEEDDDHHGDCPECGEDYYNPDEPCAGCGYESEKLVKARVEAEKEAKRLAAEEDLRYAAARKAPKVEYDSEF